MREYWDTDYGNYSHMEYDPPHWSDNCHPNKKQMSEIEDLYREFLECCADVLNLNTGGWDSDDYNLLEQIVR